MGMMKKELAALTGYTYRQIHNIDGTLEESLFVPDGDGYSLPEFVQRWAAYCENRSGETAELAAIKAKHEQLKMRKTQLEIDRMEGELVPLEAVQETWLEIAATVRQSFLQFGAHCAPLVVGIKKQGQIVDILDREVKRILEALDTEPVVETEEG